MFGLIPFRGRDILRRSPWDIRSLWDLESFFEDFFKEAMLPEFFRIKGQMKVDIREDENNYIVEAELPGVDKDSINLEVSDNCLTISVKHNEEIDEEQKNYIRRERFSSSMSRSFAVDNIVPEKATAKFENGLLTIILPKKNKSFFNKRRIEIK